VSDEKRIKIGGVEVKPGETRDIELKISETYAGSAVHLLVRVIRAKTPGPNVFLTAAVHGDELNGVGIIREVMLSSPGLLKGSLICVPVVNIFGFENHSRYLPDRRDLNRSFPGSTSGSLATRLAYVVYQEIVRQGKEVALLSRRLAQIHTDVDFPKDEVFFHLKEPELDHVKAFYHEMHFLSLLKEIETALPKGQIEYIEAIKNHDIVFSIGPAGTGKTFLAMAMAVNALRKGLVRRIILTRPAIEAGAHYFRLHDAIPRASACCKLTLGGKLPTMFAA